MMKNCKLITTNSYFGVFDALKSVLSQKKLGLDGKNIVFCEDKVSLMAERVICAGLSGSFNTDVYSFGKFLHLKNQQNKTLSKEGAAMAVKRILSNTALKRFSASKESLAPSLYELIIQLKSAGVKPSDILAVTDSASGLLKHKLEDIYSVFSAYEQFLLDNNYDDQSSLLTLLVEEIEKDENIKDADVFLVGYRSWTKQAKDIIKKLISNAKSVTAILTSGDNEQVFLNETAENFKALCTSVGAKVIEEKFDSGYSTEGKILVDNLFNPLSNASKVQSDNVYLSVSATVTGEVERVCEIIKKSVVEGKYRYRDFTLALPSGEQYKTAVKQAFRKLEIPYFLDERKLAKNHPLVRLILCYVEVFRRNFDREDFIAFIKNPLILEDKIFIDRLENYLIKYNITRTNLRKPFTLGSDGERAGLNEFMAKVLPLFNKCDILALLEKINAKTALERLSQKLSDYGEKEISDVTEQIYDAALSLLSQIKMLLGDTALTYLELKQILSSGFSAMELSIIPQYADAVFVGAYREVALAQNKFLFALGLDASVPDCSPDIALLSDVDLTSLENLNLLVEPKIKIVNEREKESVAMAISAFSEKLFLSYTGAEGANESEIISYAKRFFTIKKWDFKDEYLTFKQGLITFAKSVGEFADGRLEDFTMPSSFYNAANAQTKKKIDDLLNRCNKEVKLRLDLDERSLIGGVISPTVIEGFYNCPYRAFLSQKIKLQDREIGELEANNYGNFLHAVLEKFALRINDVNDEESSDKIVDEIALELLSQEEYSRMAMQASGNNALKRLISESKKHCYRIFNQLSRSKFRPIAVEGWTDREVLSLVGGKIKLSGRMDRVDGFEKDDKKYVRIIDYKSGSDVETTDTELFTGRKLQLYLYASTFEKDTVAGLYYYMLSNKYQKEGDKKLGVNGKTLADDEMINAQDDAFTKGESDFIKKGKGALGVSGGIGAQTLNAYIDYSVKVASKAAEQMLDGVIVASPFEGACEYCSYKGLCGVGKAEYRTVGVVNDSVILDAVKKEGEQNG